MNRASCSRPVHVALANRARFWLGAIALVAAAVFAVFGDARSYGFVGYDDGDYVFGNPHLRAGSLAERVQWAFTTFHAANWHPVTWLSFIADGVLFGLEPGWCHVENLLLHGVNTLLVLWLLMRLTGSVGKSALVAALFALHPLRAESVAWVTERKGLLLASLALLTFHAHVSHARRPSSGRFLAVAALFAGALLAKPQAVVLPLVLLVADWWPLARLGPGSPLAPGTVILREKGPLLVLAGAAAALTIAAQREAAAVPSLQALPLAERLASACVAPAAYLAKSFWPAGLSPAYPFGRPPDWQIAGAVLAFAGITAAAVLARRRQPWLAAGWLGFLLLLAPVSNLVQAGGQALADRYTYLPHVPLLAALIWSGWHTVRTAPRLRLPAASAALCLVVALGLAARRQTGFWRDDLTLFGRAVAVTAGNWKMHYNLANTLERLGREVQAEEQYRLALAAWPDYAEALNNLGALHGRRGETGQAAALFARAVRLQPGYAPAWFNLANLSEQTGDLAGALAGYGRAAALLPAAADPRVRLGRVLARLGQLEEAGRVCSEALRLDPGSAGAATCLREAAAGPAPAPAPE